MTADHIVDFLPFEAAAWLELRLHDKSTIRIDGPRDSGKTQLLTALVNAVGDSVSMAGLSESREGLRCLRGNDHSLTLIMPALQVRGRLAEVTDLLLRQAIGVVVADDPADETWSLLEDLRMAGTRVWVSSSTIDRELAADVHIQLGTDPNRRVEVITHAGRRVYWISGGKAIFMPDQS